MSSLDEVPITYKLIVNRKGQYVLKPVFRQSPGGWKHAVKTGSKEECLAWFEKLWLETFRFEPQSRRWLKWKSAPVQRHSSRQLRVG